MTDEQLLTSIKNSNFLLGYFSFDGCQVCNVLKPKIQKILKDYPEVKYLYIDTEKNVLLRGQYLVFAVPTIIIFQEGKEIKRFSRHISIATVADYLETVVQHR